MKKLLKGSLCLVVVISMLLACGIPAFAATNGNAVRVSAIEFFDSNTSDDKEDYTAVAARVFVRNAGTPKECTLVLAAYEEDGKLCEAATVSGANAVLETKAINAEGKKIKAFVWEKDLKKVIASSADYSADFSEVLDNMTIKFGEMSFKDFVGSDFNKDTLEYTKSDSISGDNIPNAYVTFKNNAASAKVINDVVNKKYVITVEYGIEEDTDEPRGADKRTHYSKKYSKEYTINYTLDTDTTKYIYKEEIEQNRTGKPLASVGAMTRYTKEFPVANEDSFQTITFSVTNAGWLDSFMAVYPKNHDGSKVVDLTSILAKYDGERYSLCTAEDLKTDTRTAADGTALQSETYVDGVVKITRANQTSDQSSITPPNVRVWENLHKAGTNGDNDLGTPTSNANMDSYRSVIYNFKDGYKGIGGAVIGINSGGPYIDAEVTLHVKGSVVVDLFSKSDKYGLPVKDITTLESDDTWEKTSSEMITPYFNKMTALEAVTALYFEDLKEDEIKLSGKGYWVTSYSGNNKNLRFGDKFTDNVLNGKTVTLKDSNQEGHTLSYLQDISNSTFSVEDLKALAASFGEIYTTSSIETNSNLIRNLDLTKAGAKPSEINDVKLFNVGDYIVWSNYSTLASNWNHINRYPNVLGLYGAEIIRYGTEWESPPYNENSDYWTFEAGEDCEVFAFTRLDTGAYIDYVPEAEKAGWTPIKYNNDGYESADSTKLGIYYTWDPNNYRVYNKPYVKEFSKGETVKIYHPTDGKGRTTVIVKPIAK